MSRKAKKPAKSPRSQGKERKNHESRAGHAEARAATELTPELRKKLEDKLRPIYLRLREREAKKREYEVEASRKAFIERLGPHWTQPGSRIPVHLLYKKWQEANAVAGPEIQLSDTELREKVIVVLRRIQFDTPRWLYSRPHSPYGVTLGEVEVALVLDPERSPGRLAGLERISEILEDLDDAGDLVKRRAGGATFYAIPGEPGGSPSRRKRTKKPSSSWIERPGRDAVFRSIAKVCEEMLLGPWKRLPIKNDAQALVTGLKQAKSRSSKQRVVAELRKLGLLRRHPNKQAYRICEDPLPDAERDRQE